MADKQASLTNRKLNYARMQFSTLCEAQKTVPPNIVVSSCALEAGLVFLYQAYISLLAEIGEAYSHKGEPITNLQCLQRALVERGLEPVELNGLAQLEVGPSWLSELIGVQTLLLSLEHKGAFRLTSTNSSSSDELKLIDASGEQNWAVKFETALEEFNGLLDSVREAICEY